MQLDKSSKVFSRISWFDEIDSTNLELSRQLKAGATDFSAVLAGSQTNGMGRLGRKWQSPPGSSLSMSFATANLSQTPGWLSLLAAMAIRRMLTEFGVDSGIKWPNDIHVNGKKLAGILVTLEDSGVAIVGIGLNLKAQSESLDAISLDELSVEADLDSLASQIGVGYRELLKLFDSHPDEVREEYSKHSITLGRRVRAQLPGGTELIGTASAIAQGGELVILTPEPISVSAADVWHLRT